MKRLERVRHKIPKTSSGNRVVPGMFDPYMSNIIAPDHLFSGLAKNAINASVMMMSVKQRSLFNDVVIQLLSTNEMCTIQRLLSSSGTELVTLSISELYDVLLVAPVSCEIVLSHLCERREKSHVDMCVTSLRLFSSLVADTLFFPSAKIDGAMVVRNHNEDSGRARLYKLLLKARQYVNGVERICKSVDMEGVKSLLDRPNMHRLLEFFEYTLPCFGNARIVQELLFERAHQELKKGITSSNFHNSQLQAMSHVRANDWINRLAFELSVLNGKTMEWEEDMIRSVYRLLGDSRWELDLRKKDIEELRNTFLAPLLTALRTKSDLMDSSEQSARVWVSTQSRHTNSEEQLQNLKGFPRIHDEVYAKHIAVEERERRHIPFLSHIEYVSKNSNGKVRRLRRAAMGDVLELLLPTIVSEQTETSSSYVAILACFFLPSESKLYAYCVDLHKYGEEQHKLYRVGSVIREVLLSEVVYPAFHTHICTPHSACLKLCEKGKLIQRACPSILSGAAYRVLGRQQGYPPRKA